jgi:hypothetical protein
MTAIQAPQSTPLETIAFGELGGSFRGELLLPTSPGYDAARRIWNGAIDRHPACIARCTGVADVVAAVRFARERDLVVAVRSGGHGVAGHAVCDGRLVIDLSPMKGITVDPQARTARAQAGVLWGELDRETQLFGLATVGRIVTHTGIAGLTLGGGIGWLMRKYGATVDNLLSVDLVTANGELLIASESVNPDLFWGPIFHRLEDASQVLRFYREFAATAPDELTTIFELSVAPSLPFLPQDVHGKTIVMVGACYADHARRRHRRGPAAAEVWQPDRRPARAQALPGAAVDVRPIRPARLAPLLEVGGATAAHRRGDRNVRRARIRLHLGEVVLHRLPARRRPRPSRCRGHRLQSAGRRPQREHQRGLDRGRSQARTAYRLGARLLRRAPAHASGRVYLNFLGDEGQDRVRAAYGERNYERLAGLKRVHDPTNFFRINQNIQPG